MVVIPRSALNKYKVHLSALFSLALYSRSCKNRTGKTHLPELAFEYHPSALSLSLTSCFASNRTECVSCLGFCCLSAQYWFFTLSLAFVAVVQTF